MMGQDSETARTHGLDRAIAWWSRGSRLFSRGWGDDAVLTEFSDRRRYFVQPRPTAIVWKLQSHRGKQASRDGTFRSPLEALPGAAATAHVREWSQPGNETACVVLAASRDEGYWIREHVFLPLTARGIDLFLLESPFYGLRRDGRGPSEITVADHGLIALGMVLEARALLVYLKPRYRKLAIAGYSMGGHMAALTAAVSPQPLACAALATGASASAIYTRGMMSCSSTQPTSPTFDLRYERTPRLFRDARKTDTSCAAKRSGCTGTGKAANCAGSKPGISRRCSRNGARYANALRRQ